MARAHPIRSLFQQRRQEDFPQTDSPEYQYTEAVLARHKAEGLELAVRVRWFAMGVIAVLLLFLVPFPEVLYYEAILGLLCLNGWLMRRVGKVGQSKLELGLIFFDLFLMTLGMVGPNPLSEQTWPHAMQYRFENFIYFFVLLAGGTLAYSWRTVIAIGTWTAGLWLGALMLSLWLVEPLPGLSEGMIGAFPDQPDMALLLDPNSYRVELRVQEIAVFLIVALSLAVSVRRFNGLLRSNAALERERTNLSRYFSPNVVEALSTNDEPLKKIRNHDIAVLFVDIVGFTEFAAERRPEEVIETLREFHVLMETAVFSHGGTLDKYLGDGLMVTFGTPEPTERDAINALECVHDMMERMDVWNNDRIARGLIPLRVGFGAHYGPAVLADIGANRLEFAVVGNTVNVASRLEALTRGLNARLVISDGMHDEVVSEGGHDCLSGLRRFEDQDIRGVERKLTVWAFERPAEQSIS
ncbi:adenylate/guanylate cyclase domain-containing protein [Shimia abyssi]|uniref:Adenylate/guanylate cyclase n=1 Tax=Shimia abyssi TaxID=1662395 RepID=A0A2P8FI12_9RHOB|nr:adenylate/guanylate cyclase domain-containing protein [Shimia abyssi]PSL21334.1 adenylate/guanylate cyclase [Shimia abyssi]